MWKIGAALYCCLDENDVLSHARMFKSLDHGLTWVALDTGNEPGTGANQIAGNAFAFYPGSGTVIYVVWIVVLGGLDAHWIANTFDTASDTWGVASGMSTDPQVFGGHTPHALFIARVSSGDIYVIGTSAANGNIVFVKLSGGVWTGPTNVTAVVANQTGRLKSILVDATDTIHVVFQNFLSTTDIATLKYLQLSAGVASGVQTLATGANPFDVFNVGSLVFWQGTKLVIPFQNTFDSITSVFIGTPLAVPVFAITIVDPGGGTVPPGNGAFYPCSMLDDGGDLHVFWAITTDFDANDSIFSSTNTGAGFDAPAKFYDNGTNPVPNEDPASPGLTQISSPCVSSLGILWDGVTLAGHVPSFFIPSSSVTPVGPSFGDGVIDAHRVPISVLPDPRLHCPFLDKNKETCRYAYSSRNK